MKVRTIFTFIGVSAVVALVLVSAGIFVFGGMVLPHQRMSYGLVQEMFGNPEFLQFHLQAFLWLFASALISCFVSHRFISGRGKVT